MMMRPRLKAKEIVEGTWVVSRKNPDIVLVLVRRNDYDGHYFVAKKLFTDIEVIKRRKSFSLMDDFEKAAVVTKRIAKGKSGR